MIASQVFELLFSVLSLIKSPKQDLQYNIKCTLDFIFTQTYQTKDIDSILSRLDLITEHWNWHSRKLVPVYIHNFMFNNLFVAKQNSEWMDRLCALTLRMLKDEVIEVRSSTMITLRGLLKWNIFDQKAKVHLVELCKANAINKDNDLVVRHSAILGLCAFIYAYSYEMNHHLADIVLFLSKRLSDPQPIQKAVSQALRFIQKDTRTLLD